jgi:2-oxoisovalerate dehydrogenase E1 component
MRSTGGPALVIFEVDRLCSHSNADDERVYRPEEEIQAARTCGDPIRILAEHLRHSGVSQQKLDELDAAARDVVKAAADRARTTPDPEPVFTAVRPLTPDLVAPGREFRGSEGGRRLTMAEAINGVLRDRLGTDPRVVLLGEDIEDPKGDVFGVTRGLSWAFPGRVLNTALSEATIIGTAIGRALAGARPVAFLQFADFLPVAFNQIFSEMGTMYWRTVGGWQCPVLVLCACGAYRPGLGPFHAESLESIMAQVPGVDVFIPSDAADSAGLLQAAFESGRPTLFFYPKVCLNDPERSTSDDLGRQWVPPGKARLIRSGTDLTLVSWGSTVPICEKVAASLAQAGVEVDLLDLRTLAPWDRDAVCASARRTGNLLVVHEASKTCGFGAEVVAAVTEAVGGRVAVRRLTRADTYVPCNFANQLEVLPSFRRVLETAAEMTNLQVHWERPPANDAGQRIVEAVGSSPTDQSVAVLSWNVKVGDTVAAGQLLAELEADKAIFDLAAPVDGKVTALLVPEGERVRVGGALLALDGHAPTPRRKRPTREEPGIPVLRRCAQSPPVRKLPGSIRVAPAEPPVGLSSVTVVRGSRTLTNEELARIFPGKDARAIWNRSGIESRPRLGLEESAVNLAVAAARQALERSGLATPDLAAIICSTSTPVETTPSTACRVLHGLCDGSLPATVPAYDINAACSGYLYALAAGYDLLQSRPGARILIVTTEALSQVTDPGDFSTEILFGDAASATVLYGAEHFDGAWARLSRPVLAAVGDNGSCLRVPSPGSGFMMMDGRVIYREAIRCMGTALARACAQEVIELENLSRVVPHQANGRIIEALRDRLGLGQRVVNHIRHCGNTGSSSIPLVLAELGPSWGPGRVGLCAFGGGFTFGAAVLNIDPKARAGQGATI